MTAHIANELPRLLTGEATRDEVMAAAEHLRGCVDCQHELVSAVVAHASLTSARRFAPEIVAGLPADLFAEPQVEDETGGQPAGQPPLPDLSAVFAQVRQEAEQPRAGGRHGTGHGIGHGIGHGTGRTRTLVLAAAAVVVVGGAGTAVYLATTGDNGAAGRTVQLAAYDQGSTSATATIGSGRLDVDAASLPRLSGKRYEVWLTNGQRTQMQPVGWIGANGTATLTVPRDLLDRFSDIEVSVQPLDAKTYDYSGTSVLRGGYE